MITTAARWIGSFTIVICSIAGFSQTGDKMQFHHLQSRQGLSQNDVLTLFQDGRGFMWIGTNDGLNQYDGYSIKTYQYELGNDHSISSNLASCIDEDPFGNLWIGTQDRGVCMYNRNEDRFIRLEEVVPDPGIRHVGRVAAIKVENDQMIWAGSSSGLHLFCASRDSEVPYQLKDYDLHLYNESAIVSTHVTSIELDTSGHLFIGTISGLYVRNGVDDKIMPDDITFRSFIKTGSNYINDMLLGEKGIYLAYMDGLFFVEYGELDKHEPGFKRISEKNFSCIEMDMSGNIWAGSLTGLCIFNRISDSGWFELGRQILSNVNDPHGLSSNSIRSMLVDQAGSVWVGTKGGGVNVYSAGGSSFKHYTATSIPGSIIVKKVLSLFEDSAGNTWLGTDGGGITVQPYHARKNLITGFILYESFTNEGPTSTVCFAEWKHDSSNTHIIYGGGFNSSLGIVELEDLKIVPGSNILPVQQQVFALSVIGDRELWVGTYEGGIYCYTYDEKKDCYEQKRRIVTNRNREGSLSSNIVRAILEDKEGNVWIGTDKGLNLLPSEEKFKEAPRFIIYRSVEEDTSTLSHDYIVPMMESSTGEIWIGTLGGGLNRIVKGLDGNYRFQRITTSDGLPNNSVKCIVEDGEGMIWVSSNKGLTKLDPQSLEMRNFGVDDGLQDLEFSETCGVRLSNGSLLFGGVNGINIFDPELIQSEPTITPVVITSMSILNLPVHTGQFLNGRVILPVSITETSGIGLKYKENSFSFEFSDLLFFKMGIVFYRYRLEGFDKEWIYLGRNEHSASYTNVPPGRFKFLVAATDIDGVWNDSNLKQLEIRIKPPFYRSIAAFIVYGVLVATLMILFRKYTFLSFEEKSKYEMERFQKEQTELLTQSKLRFFTNISHEFRSPLTLIVGPLETLIKSGRNMLDTERGHYYGLMRRNSQLLLRLIDQLMDFRKLEHGKMKLQISKVNLLTVLKDIYHVFEDLAISRNISFNMDFPSDQVELWCDLDKVEKIMDNLLSNAFKYVNDNGEVTIRVVDGEDEFQDTVQVEVGNTGMGISEEYLAQVFERFYRYDQSSKSEKMGAGVGLAFAKTLVELHQGSIMAESRENEWTRFTITLRKGNSHFDKNDIVEPAVRNTGLREIAYAQSKHFLTAVPAQFTDDTKDSQKALLVVEDNPESKYFLSHSLSNKYKVYMANNGEEGLNICYRVMPELIISDIIMPVMDGYELCSKLKSDERVSHIPLILLTSKSTEADQIAGLKYGAEAYVSKPFSIDVLEAQISAILQARERARKRFVEHMVLDPEDQYTSLDRKFLDRLTKMVNENMEDPTLSVKFTASQMGMSQLVLNKKLKALTGLTANAFIRNLRLKKAAFLIEKNQYFVSDVAYEVGFNDVKYFRNCFKAYFKVTPTEYAKQSRKESE